MIYDVPGEGKIELKTIILDTYRSQHINSHAEVLR